jgi:hypothetical protein
LATTKPDMVIKTLPKADIGAEAKRAGGLELAFVGVLRRTPPADGGAGVVRSVGDGQDGDDHGGTMKRTRGTCRMNLKMRARRRMT